MRRCEMLRALTWVLSGVEAGRPSAGSESDVRRGGCGVRADRVSSGGSVLLLAAALAEIPCVLPQLRHVSPELHQLHRKCGLRPAQQRQAGWSGGAGQISGGGRFDDANPERSVRSIDQTTDGISQGALRFPFDSPGARVALAIRSAAVVAWSIHVSRHSSRHCI